MKKVLPISNSPKTRTWKGSVFLKVGGWLLVVGSLASGCAKANAAATVPDGPPLATPAPPPREVGPLEELAAAPVGAATPDAPVTSTARPSTPTAKPPVRREPESKPDPVAAQPPAPAAAPAPTAAEPPREVRSATSAAEERKVRDVLNRAAAEIKRVDYQRLSVERKSQYDQSKRFAEQAEQALKDRNVPYAMTLADKAKQLADELAALR